MDGGLENIMRGSRDARKEMWEQRAEELLQEAQKFEKLLPTIIISGYEAEKNKIRES